MLANLSTAIFWNSLTDKMAFTGINDVTVWQDVIISALLIPVVIFLGNKLLSWWTEIQPTHLVLKNFLQKDKNIFIFHSQMSGADEDWNFNPNQKYITRFPDPLPSNHANLSVQPKKNVDPVISQAESDCLTDIYNTLGRAGKIKSITRGDLINDWNIWSRPIISVGFNPKSMKLIEKCKPVFFELILSANQGFIKIKEYEISYGATMPNDAGIIQKTFIKNSAIPVLLLAGLGTMGTSITGYILRKNVIDFGKLYGNKPFCAFLKVKINEGREAVVLDKIFPRPSWDRIALYPTTFLRLNRRKVFEYT